MALTKVSQHSLGNSAVSSAKLNLTTLSAGNTTLTGTANVSQGLTSNTLTVSTNTATIGTTLYCIANGQIGVKTSTPFAAFAVNTPSRNDGGTNPLGSIVAAGPISDSPSYSLASSTAIFRIQGSNATNNLQFGIGDSGYGYNPWIQGSYDNGTGGGGNNGSKDILLQPLGGSVGIGTTSVYEKLQVNGNIYLNGYTFISRYGAGNSSAVNLAEVCKFGTDTQVYHDGVTLSSAGQAVVRFCGSRAEVIRMRNNSGYAIYAEAGGITSASDYRIKENITEIPNAWDKVKQINPVEYNVKEDWDYERRHQRQAGFLAHELQALLPSAVGGTKDEVDEDGNPVMQGVDYSKVTPLLAAALKQALYKIETLEAKVAVLEGNA